MLCTLRHQMLPRPARNSCNWLSSGGQDAKASEAAAETLLEEVKAAWEEREAEDADLRSRLQARDDEVTAYSLFSCVYSKRIHEV